MNKIIPVILCGGSGTRLWPLSRAQTPKQFFRLMDNRSLLQITATRTLAITEAPENRIVTVTLSSLKAETISQLNEISPDLGRHVLGEPSARNTAAAIAYAANYVRRHFGDDSILWILPADHYIGDEQALKDALAEAVSIATGEYLVVFGIEPTRAETGYGYILKSEAIQNSTGHLVEKFVEKPNQDVAEEFVNSGLYLWNSGMHVFRCRTVIDYFLKYSPATYMKVEEAIEMGASDKMPDRETYCGIAIEPFEKAVLEKSERVAVVPADPQWSDIGSFESLWEIRAKNQHGNALDGKVVCQDTENSMILSHDRLVTCVGMRDVIIIETGDSVLVANKKCGDSLRALVSSLQKLGRREAEFSLSNNYSWGSDRFITETSGYRLRELNINPGSITDQHQNHNASGYWVIASGEAVVMVNGSQMELTTRQTFSVPPGSPFSIANIATEPLRLLEFQYMNKVATATTPPEIKTSIAAITEVARGNETNLGTT